MCLSVCVCIIYLCACISGVKREKHTTTDQSEAWTEGGESAGEKKSSVVSCLGG